LYVIILERQYSTTAVLNMLSERGAVLQDSLLGAVLQDSLLEQTVLLSRGIFLEVRDRDNP
jgi:hypothetical protein